MCDWFVIWCTNSPVESQIVKSCPLIALFGFNYYFYLILLVLQILQLKCQLNRNLLYLSRQFHSPAPSPIRKLMKWPLRSTSREVGKRQFGFSAFPMAQDGPFLDTKIWPSSGWENGRKSLYKRNPSPVLTSSSFKTPPPKHQCPLVGMQNSSKIQRL